MNKSVSLFHTQFVLDLLFFFKQFQSLWLWKFFLYKNQSLVLIWDTKKENNRKQLSIKVIKVLRFLILGEKYLEYNLSLELFFWGEGGEFSQDH